MIINNNNSNSNNNNNNKNKENNNNNNFLNFSWFLFVNKRIYNLSSTLTVIHSVVGHINWDICISFQQLKSSGFSHSLLPMHAEYIVGRSYAYVYCCVHYKIHSFFR